jgi:hypothetical protein
MKPWPKAALFIFFRRHKQRPSLLHEQVQRPKRIHRLFWAAVAEDGPEIRTPIDAVGLPIFEIEVYGPVTEGVASLPLHFDGNVRQGAKAREPCLIIIGPTLLVGRDRDDGAQVAGTKSPNVKIGKPVAVGFDRRAHALGHAAIWSHVQQDGTGVADERIGPSGDNDSANEADHRIHPRPAEKAAQQKGDDDKERDRGVGQDVHDGGAHIVVAVCVGAGGFVIVSGVVA